MKWERDWNLRTIKWPNGHLKVSTEPPGNFLKWNMGAMYCFEIEGSKKRKFVYMEFPGDFRNCY